MPRDLSFPRTRRLTRTAEFDYVRKHGKVWRGSLVTLVVAPAPESKEKVRAGIIASRKVGLAVVRNRVRRRLREILRKRQLEITGDIWLVIIASARSAHVSYRQLEDEYLRLAGRASILTP